MNDHAIARRNMVDCQLRPNNITSETILRAMGEIPRELFVPAAKRAIAYIDEDIDVGHGRWLMEPMVFARMLETVRLEPTDIVLDIGCGTGYSTAVLARLADTVVAVEDVSELVHFANDTMTELAIGNAVVKSMPLVGGCPSEAPYDVVIINGGVAEIPAGLIEQLNEGGRLAAIIRPDDGPGRMTLLSKHGDAISRTQLYDASIPPLDAFMPLPSFVF